MSSGRSKPVWKQTKTKKKKEQTLDDADDYLAAGVDDEDAMGKHRGGDPVKSLRFARKARELYIDGLKRYPRNFDLAYNKARLELEIATHPAFVDVLDVPVSTVLQWSLVSHEYALDLDQENGDLLFNTAQVLTGVAEEASKNDESPEEVLAYLSRALDLQQRCFTIQNLRLAESEKQLQEAIIATAEDEDEDGGVKLDVNIDTALDDSQEQQEWYAVIEPVTTDTLIDTLIAQLNTLTVVCNVLSSAFSTQAPVGAEILSFLSQVESQGTKLLRDVLPNVLVNVTLEQPRLEEIATTKIAFSSAVFEVAYRSQSIELTQYRTELYAAFDDTQIDSAVIAIGNARALINLNSAAADHPQSEGSASVRWGVLSKAQNLLTHAARVTTTGTDVNVLATTHFLRGNISMLLSALASPPNDYEQAKSNQHQLLKNAVVFYRNAARIFGTNYITDHDIAEVRGASAQILLDTQSDHAVLTAQTLLDALKKAMHTKSAGWIHEQIEDMVSEGSLLENMFDEQHQH